MWQCTCDSPPVIDLTDSFGGESRIETPDLLRSTLSKWGWCHVSIDTSKLGKHDKQPFRGFVKMNLIGFFDEDELGALQGQDVVYRGRTAESGSSSAADAEPKQSLEVRRCSRANTPLHENMNTLHSIAEAVTRSLSIPKSTLLQEGPCRCSADGNSCSPGSSCNVDLLRMFLYDQADASTLGSSAHTDWGSWTVVWQDSVGGLQTYCPVHETYVDVEAMNESEVVYFVVHVGDVTSLALGHASREEGTRVSFPSPKHRVVSPNDENRISLVYFAYPPPSISLAQIETRLAGHPILNGEVSKTDYDSYYLLQNQTPGGQAEDPKNVYKRIRGMQLSECFEEKWEQVQRGD